MNVSQRTIARSSSSDVALNEQSQSLLLAELKSPRSSLAEALHASPISAPHEIAARDTEDRIRQDERRRIADEIDKSTSTLLSVLDLQVLRLQQSFLATNPNVRDILAELGDTVSELHEEVWAIGAPQNFDPRKLRQQLEAMIAECARSSGCRIEALVDDLSEGVPATIAQALFRVAQEALANVFRHSHARAVKLSMSTRGRMILLRIEDDGHGFSEACDVPLGHGLNNMRTRIEDLGGTLVIGHLERGTVIEARLFAPA